MEIVLSLKYKNTFHLIYKIKDFTEVYTMDISHISLILI